MICSVSSLKPVRFLTSDPSYAVHGSVGSGSLWLVQFLFSLGFGINEVLSPFSERRFLKCPFLSSSTISYGSALHYRFDGDDPCGIRSICCYPVYPLVRTAFPSSFNANIASDGEVLRAYSGIAWSGLVSSLVGRSWLVLWYGSSMFHHMSNCSTLCDLLYRSNLFESVRRYGYIFFSFDLSPCLAQNILHGRTRVFSQLLV